MVKGIQIIGVIIGLLLIYVSYRLAKKKQIDINYFLLGNLFGILLIISSLFLDFFNYFLEIFGIKNRAILILSIGIVILLLIQIKVLQEISKFKTNFSRMNEEISLLKTEETKKKK